MALVPKDGHPDMFDCRDMYLTDATKYPSVQSRSLVWKARSWKNKCSRFGAASLGTSMCRWCGMVHGFTVDILPTLSAEIRQA